LNERARIIVSAADCSSQRREVGGENAERRRVIVKLLRLTRGRRFRSPVFYDRSRAFNLPNLDTSPPLL
jgi:hypothetical protein